MRNTDKIIDITGQKFNHLTAIRIESRNPLKWLCKCDCGNLHIVSANNLKRGQVKSCGCLKQKGTRTTHGMSNTRIYRIYKKINRRCNIESDPAYQNYGGRGIKMCKEWEDSFEAFYEWSLESGYSDSLSIDRIDNNGDYCPENCRWSTYEEQANNRRSCINVTYQGRTQTVKQWCKELGLRTGTVYSRIEHGWSAKEAIAYNKDARIKKRGKEKQYGQSERFT